ncbi:PAO [Ectocarpus sp. CCAP 1310/34]|nr:PAO [Ectocarpus sp. CCAP 1310/34]
MRTRRHGTAGGGLCFDHGAAYIHGTLGNPLVDLAKGAGIGLKQVSESNPWIEATPSVSLFYGGKRAGEAETAANDEAFSELMGRVRTMAQGCDDAEAPARDAIEKLLLDEPFRSFSMPELARLRMRVLMLALWHGCDVQDMQLRSLEFENKPFHGGQGVYGDFPGPHCVVEGGVERIAEVVASPQVRECLRLNARVSRVAIVDAEKAAAAAAIPANKTSGGPAAVSKGEHVQVVVHKQVVGGGSGDGAEEEEEELVRAEAVIVAVPLSVLQEGTVEFDPPLSEETSSALSRLSMGNYEKIMMEFAEPFWPADTPFIGCCCGYPRPPPSPPSLHTAPPAAPVPTAPVSATADGGSYSPAPPAPRPRTTVSGSARMTADGGGVAPPSSSGATNPASLVAAENGHTPALAAAAAGAAATAAAESAESAVVGAPPLSVSPVFLENHLWSKGVPVLTAAVTGERARMVSAAARTMARGEGAGNSGAAEEGWRASHAREMYRRLIKPALVEGLGGTGEDLPEPVSVFVTSWGQEPFQRGSYSFFPLGARDDDIHTAGRGAAFGPPRGAAEGGAGGGSERVFFAGEATVPGLEGSMHGAYLSGVRAAEDVAYAFGLPL